MAAILLSSARHGALVIAITMLPICLVFGQTIDFSWTSEGAFQGSPSSGTVDTTFSSSAPLNLKTFHATYTGQGGANSVFGPFEITAESGDKLFGNYDILGEGPIRLGMNIGNGTFMFTGGTGQFAGATGQGNMEVTTTLLSFPTNTGTVEQEWQGSIMLVPATVPGDYNGNGTVDAADYVVWRHSVGQTGAGLAADGDDNDTIDDADYGVWKANFGATSAASLINSRGQVPEPPSVAFAAIVLVLFAVMSPRERSL